MNNWNIPDWLEKEVNKRDKSCVYCRAKFVTSKRSKSMLATWEHIINDAKIINKENIARCCVSCNSSKGAKRLSDWLKSDYCKRHRITKSTVAEVVRKALAVK
jgi:5-methylcytosine-specific restriction endonuclease McrA